MSEIKTKVVPFNLAKCLADGGKCFTSDGDKARIIATDRKGDRNKLVALITQLDGEGGNEYCHIFAEDGTHSTSGKSDLHLVLHEQYKTVEGYVAVYSYNGEVKLAQTPLGFDEGRAVEFFLNDYHPNCKFLGIAKYTAEVKV